MIRNIFLVMIFLIIYGSLYPFDFQFQGVTNAELNAFFQTWLSISHKGDIVANILIFIPFGFVGAYYLPESTPRLKVVSIITLLAILLGFGLQVLQLFLPSRDQNLSDGMLNMAGTWLGLFIAMALNISVNDKVRSFSISLPLLLITSWFTYKLLPFVPSLDWQEIKDSVKPLLLYPRLDPVNLWQDMAAWSIVLFLLERTFKIRQPLRDAGLVLLSCLLLEVLIINNSISLSNILGSLAGYSVWLLLRKSAQQTAFLILICLLSGYFVIYSFAPFEIPEVKNSFSWIPFSGFLGDSMFHNTLAFIEKFFFYGSLVWLMLNAGLRTSYVAMLSAAFLLLLEIGQIFIGHHTPEITDPLLALILVYFFALIKREHVTVFEGDGHGQPGCSNISIVLFIESDNNLNQTPSQGLTINKIPFYVGRISDTHGKHLPRGRSLLINDFPPYQLSRKHFRIDFKNGHPIIKDTDSTLGTVVNGITVGKKHDKRWSRLNPGENTIIAGDLDNGIKFKITLIRSQSPPTG